MFMKNNDIMISVFMDIIEYLNRTNLLEKNILVVKSFIREDSKRDNNIFFKSGQLLAMFYLFNEDTLRREDINYRDGIFYIKNMFNRKVELNTSNNRSNDSFNNSFNEDINDDLNNELNYINNEAKNNSGNSCINIAEKIINTSVYKKEFLLKGIEVSKKEEGKSIELGFIQVYNYLLGEKFSLIKIIEKYGHDDILGEVINRLKILNKNDLNRQLTLIKLRLGCNYCTMVFNKEITGYDKDKFIKLSCKIADELIQSSIIGVYNNDIELTWLRYSKNNIIPMAEKNIYVSLFLSYLSKNTSNKYYLQPAIQSIKPAIRALALRFSGERSLKRVDLKYEQTLSTFYYVNTIVYIDELKNFIDDNKKLFKSFNKENIDKSNLLNESLKIINQIII